MALATINPTSTEAWKKLKQHYAQMATVSTKEMFANDTSRAEKFSLQWNDFLVDYSKNCINEETITLLGYPFDFIKVEKNRSSYLEQI